MKQSKTSTPSDHVKSGNPEDAHNLLTIVEKSQVPFGQSADTYNRLKTKIDSGKQLTASEFEELQRLVKIAKDWEKGVQSSAVTEPKETLAG